MTSEADIQQRWISVEDRPPKPYTEVLVAVLNPVCDWGCCGAFYSQGLGMLQGSGEWVIDGHLTQWPPEYWMFKPHPPPLPDPPEVEDDPLQEAKDEFEKRALL